MKPVNSARLPQAARFVIAGTTATLSHWLVMALLVVAGLLPAIATGVGAIAGALVNYVLQKNYAFRSGGSHRFELPRYLFACMVLWLANLVLFILLHQLFTVAIAQFITTALVAFMSYWLYGALVFGPGGMSLRNERV